LELDQIWVIFGQVYVFGLLEWAHKISQEIYLKDEGTD
jgi:hypothetical protein